MRVIKAKTFETIGNIPIKPQPCSCGLVHIYIPAGAKVLANPDDCTHYWWNCQCGSTLTKRIDEVEKEDVA